MSNQSNFRRILVIEDSDAKFTRLEKLITSVLDGDVYISRASTVTDAETKIVNEEWFAHILDVSMDIAKSTAGPKLGGHATLGGLNIATKTYLLGREAPTIIVTAFDSFQETQAERSGYDVLGLEDVERRARDILGPSFVGYVRYGDQDWENKFTQLLWGIIAK